MVRLIPVLVFLIAIIVFGAYWSRTRIQVKPSIESFEDCVDTGYPVMESYPRRCSANGKTFTEDIPGDSTQETDTKNITISSPKSLETLSLPFTIVGEARVFENSLSYRVLDQEGKIIRDGYLTADSPDIGQFGGYFQNITWVKEAPSGQGKIEVFSYSPKDGSEINLISVAVAFDFNKATKINSYFNKKGNDDCNVVFPLTRLAAKTQTPLRESLLILLNGPISQELEDGFITNINLGTTFESVNLQDGEATVNFNKNIEENVGGSCRVSAIRSQISETLKQFPSVSTVRILVEGREDDVLQP